MKPIVVNGGGNLPPQYSIKDLSAGFIGGSVSILVCLYLGAWCGLPWLMAPFGASCVLLYALPLLPASQPRNIIGGHLLATAVGLLFLQLFGANYMAISLAVGSSILLMQLFRMVHPPAGANPIVVILAAEKIDFIIFPTLLGALTLVIIAVLLNALLYRRIWPLYWWGKSA